jgi:hypothetical protein
MLVPPELYGDLEAELACLPDERDVKNDKEIEEREKKEKEERERRAREEIELERQRELKEREKEREMEKAREREKQKEREREKQKEREREEKERERQKEKAREMEIDRKGKAREQVEQGRQGVDKPRTDTGKGKKPAAIQNETAEMSVVIPKKRRRIQSKATVDDSDEHVDDQDDSLPTNPAPLAKRVKLPDDNPPTNPAPVAKRNKRQYDTLPPPCDRCVISKQECPINGWRTACDRCHQLRQNCNHSKAYPPGESGPGTQVNQAKGGSRQKSTPALSKPTEAASAGTIRVRPRKPSAAPDRPRVSPPAAHEPLSKMIFPHA